MYDKPQDVQNPSAPPTGVAQPWRRHGAGMVRPSPPEASKTFAKVSGVGLVTINCKAHRSARAEALEQAGAQALAQTGGSKRLRRSWQTARVSTDATSDPRDVELAVLRSRVAELEAQVATQDRRTAAVVAEAQEKLYWLERWQVDLDAVMRKPGAIPALESLKRVRSLVRGSRKAKRRILGS
ncbi:MAG: hypothetical protein JWO90_1548 [Solirubrobacterales bacterium]|nr:hypothetical protein [Solirubrobacterales bacterium]